MERAGWARRACVWLFWPALAVVIWGELSPHPPHLEVSTSDKLLHFLAYFGLSAIAVVALRGRRLVLIILCMAALGGMLEILQHFTGRDAEWLDEAANTAGAVFGALSGVLFLRLIRARD